MNDPLIFVVVNCKCEGKPMGLRAVNQTKGTVVAEHVEMASNFWTRFKGLMLRKGLPEGHGLWIVPCKDIHAFFMRFEFDAVFISKTGEVVHLVERMKPWRVSKYVRKGHAVLELDGGVIAKTTIALGDVITLEQV